MATQYPANPAGTHSPSPTPGPGVLPIVNVPADGDALNSATLFQQQYETLADFVGHVQTAVRLDVPVLNVAGTGFTSPVNTGLGGTITPSGNAHNADGTRFVIQIQTGGAVGTATFKTSMDGGNTYGALQTTAASMTDATSGITLAFSGTFTANGTCAFRSAFTPQAQQLDAAGNVRSIVDHNGYRRGRTRELYEDWRSLGVGNISGAGSTVQVGTLTYTLPTSATLAAQAASSVMPGGGYTQIGTTNVANSTTLRVITPPVWSPQTNGSLVVEFDVLLLTASAVDWKFGFVNTGSFGAQTVTGTPNSSENAFAVVKQASDTTWQIETAINGTGFTKTPTTITPSTTAGVPDRITMELHGSGSPYGTRARVWINEQLVLDGVVTNIPTNTAAGFSFVIAGTTTSATNAASIAVSPVRAVWNAYTSTPGV